MYISKIYIRDFGILSNQLLENLSKGIVVIGGKNRAGKTTMFNILRNISYGFLKSDNLPKPKFKYYIESLIKEENQSYNVKLEGYKNPIVKGYSGEFNLYGIDRNSYERLFTVDLNELHLNFVKDKKLQSILLGAGLKDLIKMPYIIKNLQKDGDKIGGKQGNPNTKMFKVYSNNIKNIVLKRDIALEERNEFLKLKNNLERNSKVLSNKYLEMKQMEQELKVISLVKDNFKNYFKFLEYNKIINDEKNLKIKNKFEKCSLKGAAELKEKYLNILDKYNIIKRDFESMDINIDKKFFVRNIKWIESYSKRLSGIKEKYKNYTLIKDENYKKKKYIESNIDNLNCNFYGNIDEIMNIKCDFININKLSNSLNDKKIFKNNKEDLKRDISNLSSEYRMYLYSNNNHFSFFIKIGVICILILWIIFTLKDIKFDKIFTIFMIMTIGYFIYDEMKVKKGNSSQNIKNIKQMINKKKIQISNMDKNIETIEKEFDYYRKELKIENKITDDGVKEYLKEIKNIKANISDLNFRQQREKKMDKEINVILDDIGLLFDNMYKKRYEHRNSWNYIFSDLEKIIEYSEIANMYNKWLYNKCETEKIIKEYFNIKDNLDLKKIDECIENIYKYNELKQIESEREKLQWKLANSFKNQLKDIKDDDVSFKIQNLFHKYLSEVEIKDKYDELEYHLIYIKKEINKIEEKIQEIKYSLNKLTQSNKLEKIQKDIIENRQLLKPLAKEYASYKTAIFVLENVYKEFIQKSQKDILKNSSKVLQEITGGEYKNILLGDDLTNLDFKTILKDNSVNEGCNTLSMATEEQLFLSVRISKIFNMKSLPFIIDDSFVNFDNYHLENTINILNKLSKRNQIFIFTCHKAVIDFIERTKCQCQYWKLEEGKFTLNTSQELKDYLK